MKYPQSVSAALMALSVAVSARTPAELTSQLRNLLPANTHARFVWVQKDPVSYASITGLLYVMDSDSGNIRPVSLTAQHNAYQPHLTADGTRIVFWDWNRGETRVIGWNGQGLQTVTSRYLQDCWRNPADNSDWAIVTDDGNGGNVYRVNISTKAEVGLSNSRFFTSNPVSISQDGTHVGSFFGTGGGWAAGVADVTTGTLTLEQNSSGCVANIAPDNSYHWMHQISGHKELKISTGPSAFQQINIVDSILCFAARNARSISCPETQYDAQFNDTRWTNLRDYITFTMANIKGNPYIMRLSDKKWVSINDTLGCSYGSTLNAVILGDGTGVTSGLGDVVRNPSSPATDRVYGIDGRCRGLAFGQGSQGVGIRWTERRSAAVLLAP